MICEINDLSVHTKPIHTKSNISILNALLLVVSKLMLIGPSPRNNGTIAKSISADISAEQDPTMTYKASTYTFLIHRQFVSKSTDIIP
jgi:hypothetical protein